MTLAPKISLYETPFGHNLEFYLLDSYIHIYPNGRVSPNTQYKTLFYKEFKLDWKKYWWIVDLFIRPKVTYDNFRFIDKIHPLDIPNQLRYIYYSRKWFNNLDEETKQLYLKIYK